MDHGSLLEGRAERAMQSVLEVELAAPLDDVGEQVTVERRVVVQQRGEMQRVLGGDQVVDPHLPRGDLRPVARLQPVSGVGTPLTHPLEDHGVTISTPQARPPDSTRAG